VDGRTAHTGNGVRYGMTATEIAVMAIPLYR
jgi:hypothetical protein